jgi:ATP-dependent Clp protease ATP-binding subunit ClpB
VREEIDQLRQQIEELTRKGDFNKVAELQYGKLPALEKTLKEVQAKESAPGDKPVHRLLRTQVGAEEIAEVVSRATGIPVSKMMQGEREKLLQMEDQTAPTCGGPRRGHCGCGQCHSPFTLRPV